MLWLALHFPQLPLDRQDPDAADDPRAVVLQEGARRRILACNASATANGIRPGLALKNAYALTPNLLTSDYDEHQQLAHLEQLTLWALQYSSLVSPEPPDTILLEIAASLTLFGGLAALCESITRDIGQQHLSLSSAIAPTPAAALLFARAGVHHQILDKPTLVSTLAGAPVDWLPLNDFTLKGLRQSGIRSVGELTALPPASLTRRFGSTCTQLLYKLDGRLPDPRTAYKAAETFSQSLDLPLEAPDTNALAFPLNRLMNALGGYLKARDLGVRHVELILSHHRKPATHLSLKFLDATANTDHLFRVATERLGNLQLAAPITRLGLESSELACLQRESVDLFQQSKAQSTTQGSTIEQVLDRLSARLGKDAFYTAVSGDDHRPEKAWLSALLDNQPLPGLWPARPVWLLAEPSPLNEPVTLHTLPERIENGWWDDTDVRRDYFIASTRDGAYYWVYRQRHSPDQLWLHGLFA
ncbi:Y-family DNA polymerase [Granulosicoccus antarcticus]|uniref:DNA polymerase IV n=1 Tax=Granulosicoccus antarcticus IMCC3135 TaxID=1192854 RepID=A0A2Z2NVX1_9GAMM|nr:DNA polymerase Y family protein [Granulosicoccus antarcticus]ASJ74675.1 DNA polymerase IV [Granulosicoccus antarcticus IMCC3135]